MASVYLKKAIRRMETSLGVGPNYEFAATSCQGWRNTQEDVHLIIPNFESDTSLFAVFDGHNGVEVATFVAKYLPDYIRMNRKYKSGNIIDGLKEAFMLMDSSIIMKDSMDELRAIRHQAHPELPEYQPGFTSGCTAVVVLLKHGTFYVANVGDTRCVLSRSDTALPLTTDNKPDDPDEIERIERAGGQVVKGRINAMINVSRAFGDHMFKLKRELKIYEQMIIALPEVVVDRFNPATDQFLVLMCDGIWNSWGNDQVVDYVAKRLKSKARLGQITEEIVSQILPREMPPSGIKGKDNMTLMVVKFNSGGGAGGPSGGAKERGTSTNPHNKHRTKNARNTD